MPVVWKFKCIGYIHGALTNSARLQSRPLYYFIWRGIMLFSAWWSRHSNVNQLSARLESLLSEIYFFCAGNQLLFFYVEICVHTRYICSSEIYFFCEHVRTPVECWNGIRHIRLTCSRARLACSYFAKAQPCRPYFTHWNRTKVNTYCLLLSSFFFFSLPCLSQGQ